MNVETNTEDRTTAITRRIQVQALVNGLVLVGILICALYYTRTDYWFAAFLSAACLLITLNSQSRNLLREIRDHTETLRYELKLANSSIDRLKSDLVDAQQKDEVTGCCNRQRFFDELSRHIALHDRTAVSFSILRIRLDQYHEILARQGTRTAIETLKSFAGILWGSIRDVDITARFEEEHFAVLLTDANTTGALIVANRITNLTDQFQTGEGVEKITISIGITEHRTGSTPKALIEESETAMQLAISEGGNRIAAYQSRDTVMEYVARA